MPSKQDLRRRIRSVRSTQQLTRAMKMVYAAKLRRSQAAVLEARPYAAALDGVLKSLAGRVGVGRHPLLEVRPERSVTLVVVAGDKGLCGAFNTNILREATTLLGSGRWEHADLVLVGRRGIDYFRRRGLASAAAYPELMKRVTRQESRDVAHRLAGRYESGATDAVYVLYNRFRSILRQEVTLERLLPVEQATGAEDGASGAYIYEPSPQALLGGILPRYVEFQVLRALLDSQAAEHAARMTAMDSASKNAAEMIDRLTLTYNRARQASITKELIEIVSGAQALAER
ncbi:MAG TPA: ATP synthase F1 subunit gamma [Thermoanaerobaculaceae bacterium]|nr:ATP synthase F1 subunit gamma [Thermoanaerobaculaceae bacterium]